MFEHPGRSTMGASVFAAKRGGTVVTCAATSGYMVEFDNRHFWMKLKQLVASPLRQLRRGVCGQPADRPGSHPADAVGGATPSTTSARPRWPSTATKPKARSACCAWRPTEGLGIDDPEKRDRIGEEKITRFQT